MPRPGNVLDILYPTDVENHTSPLCHTHDYLWAVVQLLVDLG